MTADKLRDLMRRHTKALRDLTDHYMEGGKGSKAKTNTAACLCNDICAVEARIVSIEDKDLKLSKHT